MYGTKGRRLLLVEDNPGDADLILDMLAAAEPNAVGARHASSMSDALSLLAGEQFDVVLLDLNLPDSSGVGSVRSLRQMATSLPIVVLTGVDDHETAFECIVAGAQDYIVKNELQEQALLRAVAYAMARVGEAVQRQRAETLNETMAAIVSASSDAILSVSKDGTLTSWNGGAERMFGYTRDEAIGRPLNDIVRTPDGNANAERDEQLLRAFAGDSNPEPYTVRRCRRDGRVLTLSVVLCILRGADNQVVGAAGICRDVTDAQRRDDALRQRAVQLESRNLRMRALNERLNAAREDERTRIAREVHDVLGQLLTGLKMDLHWMERRLSAPGPDPAPLRHRLGEADQLVDQLVSTVQRIAIDLRPSALDALGLPAAVRDEARRFEARTGVRTQVAITAAENPRGSVATALFRILQELMWNVARHAKASRLSIELADEHGAQVMRVSDDGIGIDAAAVDLPSSLGLLGIRERCEAIGGSFHIARGPRGGTAATVRVRA